MIRLQELLVRSDLSPCSKDVSHLCAKLSMHTASAPAKKYNSRRKWGSKNANKTYCRIMRDKSQSSVSSCGRWAVFSGMAGIALGPLPPLMLFARLDAWSLSQFICIGTIWGTPVERSAWKGRSTAPCRMKCTTLSRFAGSKFVEKWIKWRCS